MIKTQPEFRNSSSTTTPVVIEIFKPSFFKSEYDFRIEGKSVGFMKFSGLLHPKAEGKLFEEEWKLSQTGIWKPFLEYKANQSPYTKSKFRLGWKSQIEWNSPDEKKYNFKKISAWKSSWAWYDGSNQPILTFKELLSFSKKQALITIHHPSQKDLALPIFLAWFMILRHKKQTEEG